MDGCLHGLDSARVDAVESVERLVHARAAKVIVASAAVEARIRELIDAGHDEYASARIAFEEASPESPEHRRRLRQNRTVHAIALHRSLGAKLGKRTIVSYPHALEVDYADSLVGLVNLMKPHYNALSVALPRLLASAQSRFAGDRADGDEILKAEKILQVTREQMTGDVNSRDVKKLARYFGERTNAQQRGDLSKQLSNLLGIDVMPDDRYVPELVNYFAAENAELIGSIPSRLHENVAQLTHRAFSKRMNPETYAQHLADQFDVAIDRARLIARDQLGSLYGQLNQVRQTGLGITHFYWETMRDARVRMAHRRRQGVRFAWDELGPDEIPGAPIACRCHAIPDVEELLAMAEAVRAERLAGFEPRARRR